MGDVVVVGGAFAVAFAVATEIFVGFGVAVGPWHESLEVSSVKAV